MKKRTGRRKLSTLVVTTPKRLGVRDDAFFAQPVSLYGPAENRTQPTIPKHKKNATPSPPKATVPRTLRHLQLFIAFGILCATLAIIICSDCM